MRHIGLRKGDMRCIGACVKKRLTSFWACREHAKYYRIRSFNRFATEIAISCRAAMFVYSSYRVAHRAHQLEFL